MKTIDGGKGDYERQPAAASSTLRDGCRSMVQINIRLPARDVARIDARASAAGLTRPGWVLALVRNHLDQAPKFRRQDEVAIIGAYDQLRRIANQLAQRSQPTNGRTDNRSAAPDRAELETLRLEIRMHMTALKTAFEGNLDSWRIADE